MEADMFEIEEVCDEKSFQIYKKIKKIIPQPQSDLKISSLSNLSSIKGKTNLLPVIVYHKDNKTVIIAQFAQTQGMWNCTIAVQKIIQMNISMPEVTDLIQVVTDTILEDDKR
jgi:hypothetical protein